MQAKVLTSAKASKTTRIAPRTALKNPALMYLASIGEGSRRSMRQALDYCAAAMSSGRYDSVTMPWHEVRYEHAQGMRSILAARYARRTVNKMLSALRGVMNQAFKLRLITGEEYHRIVDGVKNVSGIDAPVGRQLSPDELAALFSACRADTSPIGTRDAAILAILYGGGLRRTEAVLVELDDWYGPESKLVVRHGKGSRARVVYLAYGASQAVQDWVALRGREKGKLLCPVLKSGRIVIRGMTDQSVLERLRIRAEEAEVKAFTPHDLRRTFISDLLEAGNDLSTVQKAAGHASVTTTVTYDKRGERVVKDAVQALHVPYGSKGVVCE